MWRHLEAIFCNNFHPRSKLSEFYHMHQERNTSKQIHLQRRALSLKIEDHLKTLRGIRFFSSRLVWLGFSGWKQVLGQIRWRIVKLSRGQVLFQKHNFYYDKSHLFETYIFLKTIFDTFWLHVLPCSLISWDWNRFMTASSALWS